VLVHDWLPANTTLLEILLELGEHAIALSQVDELLDEHPHDLGLAKVRMAALHGIGRGTEATAFDIFTFSDKVMPPAFTDQRPPRGLRPSR
jgi:hypothetical protein